MESGEVNSRQLEQRQNSSEANFGCSDSWNEQVTSHSRSNVDQKARECRDSLVLERLSLKSKPDY